jgi:hypothetical protein
MKSGYSVRWYFDPAPARPAVPRLAAGAPPSRTLRAAQVRGGLKRTRPSLTAATSFAWQCSGRDEKTAPQPNQKTSIVPTGWRAPRRPGTAGVLASPGGSSLSFAVTCLSETESVVRDFRVSGVGFGPQGFQPHSICGRGSPDPMFCPRRAAIESVEQPWCNRYQHVSQLAFAGLTRPDGQQENGPSEGRGRPASQL